MNFKDGVKLRPRTGQDIRIGKTLTAGSALANASARFRLAGSPRHQAAKDTPASYYCGCRVPMWMRARGTRHSGRSLDAAADLPRCEAIVRGKTHTGPAFFSPNS